MEVKKLVIKMPTSFTFVDVCAKKDQSRCSAVLDNLKKKNEEKVQKSCKILDRACGAIKPGRLTFILGPSGAGKTSLIKILSGRKIYPEDHPISQSRIHMSIVRCDYSLDDYKSLCCASPTKNGVSGTIDGAGRHTVLVSQHANLIDTLTARETLRFAARLRLPRATMAERHRIIEEVCSKLGILDVLDTRAGKLSGGERKRLTVACELLTDPYIMLLDEPTSGLDFVSSMSVIQALRVIARGGRTVACVVHQPSSKLYSMADDILLIASGRTLYAGAIDDVPDTLARAGFICPQYYNMADYLLEIASGILPGSLTSLENEARSYSIEMRNLATNGFALQNGKEESSEAEALLRTRSSLSVRYDATLGQQLGALLWRCYKGLVRDMHLTHIRLLAHLLVALLLGALYNGAGDVADRMMTNTACIFFFLLFLFFSNAMPPIHTFPVESAVVMQEHLNKWYSLYAYCASKIIVDLPLQLLCATTFMLPAWYLTSQPLELDRMFLAWVICVLTTILAQTFGLVVGAAFDVQLGLFVVPAANIPMLMFSEFFIPYKEIPSYLRPFAVISYFRYAFDAFVVAVYGLDRPRLKCNAEFCLFRNPNKYLEHLGLPLDYMTDIYVLVTWIVFLQIAFVGVLLFRVYRACR